MQVLDRAEVVGHHKNCEKKSLQPTGKMLQKIIRGYGDFRTTKASRVAQTKLTFGFILLTSLDVTTDWIKNQSRMELKKRKVKELILHTLRRVSNLSSRGTKRVYRRQEFLLEPLL
jgi:hypothetical protein